MPSGNVCVVGGQGGLLTTGWEGFQPHVADNTLSRTSQEAVLSEERRGGLRCGARVKQRAMEVPEGEATWGAAG